MSIFLPEDSQGQPQDGVVSITPASPQTTQADVALMQRVFQAAAENPLMLPADFMSYVLDYVQTSRLIVPIGQVFGFSQFTANIATPVSTLESTTSTTFGALTTAGPSLSGVGDGKYLILFGCEADIATSGQQALMGISVNGSTPASANGDACAGASTTAVSGVSIATAKTLSNAGSNTITAQYASSGGSSASFRNRWLIALKFAN